MPAKGQEDAGGGALSCSKRKEGHPLDNDTITVYDEQAEDAATDNLDRVTTTQPPPSMPAGCQFSPISSVFISSAPPSC